MQHGLIFLGYDIRIVDGFFGSRTRQGIAEYLRAKGLPSNEFLTSGQSEALMALGEARDNLSWLDAQTDDTPIAYRRYLSEFPRGLHAAEARSRLVGKGRGQGNGTAATNLESELRLFLDVVGRRPSASHIDENGWTDLHYAALLNLPRLAEVLVDAELSVEQRLKSDGRKITNELLLRIRPYLKADSFLRIGSTPLHLAAYGNAVNALDRLVAKGASINAKAEYGVAPLHYAAWANALDALNWLTAKGADPYARNDLGQTPSELIGR